MPIDGARGFPQSFSMLFGGTTYHFRLYVNIAASRLSDEMVFLDLPDETTQAFLVAQVERELPTGSRETVFVRKVIPEREYEVEEIALTFGRTRVARKNLNGRGELGSQVQGGIASRWE